MKLKYKVSAWAFALAGIMVIGGLYAQRWALDTNNQYWVNMSPDVMGAGLLVFALGVLTFIIGLSKKVKWLEK